MRSEALEDLFIQELEEVYDAEKQIWTGLSQMAKASFSSDLKSAFLTHQKQTKNHVNRLAKSFSILSEKPRRGNAYGVSGLIKQSKQLAARDSFDRAVTDAALITIAQKIEHYEIAAYGCLRTHAGILGYKEIEELLNDSLKEEEESDKLLTELAATSINRSAAEAPYAQARTGTRGEGLFGEKASSGGKLSLGTIALGLAVGSALSLLLTPKSGAEVRNQIRGILPLP